MSASSFPMPFIRLVRITSLASKPRGLSKNCVEPHAALFLLLALGTAARHRAILDLKWSAVTWPNGGGPSGDDGVPA